MIPNDPEVLNAVFHHLRNHLYDGLWHDSCQWCLNRRRHGGNGVWRGAAVTYCDPCGGVHDHNHTLGRLGWALRTARHAEPKSLLARVRLLWHDFVLHGLLNRGTERCQDCGRDYEAWWGDDTEWQRAMGYPSGLLCCRCFNARLDMADA